ncbi:allatotropin isoform X2 [Plutella xylostella]|uniref:allatotropin isoform X2 n=1 Tax=Plutella xylostella TaxID=51655 RepID=UPI0020331045|nr:allatotropin isoform X2 [Plutella xylostella]
MNLTLQLTLVALAACLVAVEGAPDGRLPRTKQQRPTRGFKNVEMMTARGFGKRDRPAARPERDVEYTSEEKPRSGRATPRFKSPSVGVARDFGKRDSEDEVYGLDNFWESLETSPEREVVDADDKTVESIPLEWFVHEVLSNPDFARSVVRKFIDLNQDGMLSSEELLRNV